MPKKYDDEKLRQQALALRKNGLSYREIAKELGCSTYKVHEVLAEYEKNRKKKVGEMTAELAELEGKVKEFEEIMDSIDSRIYKLEKHLSKIEHTDVIGDMIDISERIKSLEAKMEIVKDYLDLMYMVGEEKMVRCRYYNKAMGACSKWEWNVAPENKSLQEAIKHLGSNYLYAPKKFPILCALCPFYIPSNRL